MMGRLIYHSGISLLWLYMIKLPIFPLNAVICDPPCENGACVANDTCACSEGFTGNQCAEKRE